VWQDSAMIGTAIPALFREGQPAAGNWDAARDTLNRFDPYRIFSSGLLDRLLP
jgi:FAD/FMN-containing dehydrogenase